MDTLPNELFIKCLEQTEFATCCLVSRRWASVVQPLLYERVEISFAKDRSKAQARLRALELTLAARRDLAERTTALSVDQGDPGGRPEINEWTLGNILLRLPSLKELSVNVRMRFDVVWLAFPPRQSLLLGRLLTFTYHPMLILDLRDVSVRLADIGTGLPPDELPCCAELESLTFFGCDFPSPQEVEPFLSPDYLPRLKSFTCAFNRAALVSSELPTSVLVACDCNWRGRSDEVAESTLYLMRLETLMDEMRDEPTLALAVRATQIRHLCLIDVEVIADAIGIILSALRDEPELWSVRTLRMDLSKVHFAPADARELRENRNIELIDLDGWQPNKWHGTGGPPRWFGHS